MRTSSDCKSLNTTLLVPAVFTPPDPLPLLFESLPFLCFDFGPPDEAVEFVVDAPNTGEPNDIPGAPNAGAATVSNTVQISSLQSRLQHIHVQEPIKCTIPS